MHHLSKGHSGVLVHVEDSNWRVESRLSYVIPNVTVLGKRPDNCCAYQTVTFDYERTVLERHIANIRDHGHKVWFGQAYSLTDLEEPNDLTADERQKAFQMLAGLRTPSMVVVTPMRRFQLLKPGETVEPFDKEPFKGVIEVTHYGVTHKERL